MNKEWKWSVDAGCYIAATFNEPPTAYCLGERYIHADYGRDSYGVLWVGSTIDNWHGYHFGVDIKEALEWVRGATRPDLTHVRWSTHGSMVERRKGERRNP